jgi:hypothetical protein
LTSFVVIVVVVACVTGPHVARRRISVVVAADQHQMHIAPLSVLVQKHRIVAFTWPTARDGIS